MVLSVTYFKSCIIMFLCEKIKKSTNLKLRRIKLIVNTVV